MQISLACTNCSEADHGQLSQIGLGSSELFRPVGSALIELMQGPRYNKRAGRQLLPVGSELIMMLRKKTVLY